MNKKINLIVSFLSMLTTAVLLIVTIFSWYTENRETHSGSIIGGTEIPKTSFELDYWNDSSWVVVNNIEKTNVLPGTTTYYRLKCVNSGDSTVSLTAKFEGISSKLDTGYVRISADNKSVTYNGIKTYDIVNNSVTVDPVVDNGDTKTVLYDISEGSISLRHFKIEEGYIIQRFGTVETTSNAILKKDDVTLEYDTISIGDPILNNQEIAIGTSYYYFALTFLDNDDIDRYFMYQGLYINSLTMYEN